MGRLLNAFLEPASFLKAAAGYNKKMSRAARIMAHNYDPAVKARSVRILEHTARTRSRANNFLSKKLAPAAIYGAASQTYAAYIENRAEQQSAYMGSSEYSARYGNSAQNAASVVRGVGTGMAAGRLLGITGAGVGRAAVNKVVRTAKKFNKTGDIIGRSKDRIQASRAAGRAAPQREVDRIKSMNRTRFKAAASLGYSTVPALAGLGALATLWSPETSIGITAGAAALTAGRPVLKYMWARKAAALTTMGTIGAGAGLGMSKEPYPAAEGNIEDVQYNQRSTVDRLNYSTAGLVQSLHRRR